jgi:prepilin-type processing-associated H-X9-DG protein
VVNPNGPIRNIPEGYHMGWLVQLLPYVEEKTAFDQIDFSVGVYNEKNAPVRALSIALFRCPSYGGPWKTSDGSTVSNYAGCHNDVEAPIAEDNHGVLYLNSAISPRDITDGTVHTIFVGEKLGGKRDLGWMSGTRATLRNTGTPIDETSSDELWDMADEDSDQPEAKVDVNSDLYVGGFGSQHSGVANFLFGDGAVRSISENIALSVYQQLGNRADGKLLTSGPTRGDY